MATLEDWIKKQNELVVGQQSVSHFKLIDALEAVWNSWQAPVEAQEIQDEIHSLKSQLPTGRHTLYVIAYAENGEILGRTMQTVDGGSAAAKAAQSDSMSMAKATRVHVDTMEVQLNSMGIRLQEAQRQVIDAERQRGEMADFAWKLAERVQDYTRRDLAAELEIREREARIEGIKTLAKEGQPLVALLTNLLVQKFAPDIAKMLDPSVGAAPEVAAASGPAKPLDAGQDGVPLERILSDVDETPQTESSEPHSS